MSGTRLRAGLLAGGIALLAAMGLGRMSEGGDMSREELAAAVTQMTDLPLPDEAADLKHHSERGIDSYLLFRFSAPAGVAEAYAQRLLGAAPEAGVNPWFNATGLDWLPDPPPEGSAGARLDGTATGRSIGLLLGAPEDGMRLVWVEVFTL